VLYWQFLPLLGVMRPTCLVYVKYVKLFIIIIKKKYAGEVLGTANWRKYRNTECHQRL